MDSSAQGGASSLDEYLARVKADREGEIANRALSFDRQEYADRLQRLRRSMAQARIDTLLLSRPESMCWLSGYTARWYRHAGPKDWVGLITVAVRVDCDEVVHFDFAGEEDMIALTSVATEVCILPESDETLPRFVNELRSRGLLGGVVGREVRAGLPDHLAATDLERRLAAAGCAVVDASDLVDDLLHLKSPAEVAYIEDAVRICDEGLRAAREAIAPGVTELEVWAEMMRGMIAAGGEPAALHEMVMAGPCFLPHIISRRRPIKRGDLVALDPCGVVHRYHGNVSRPVFVGEPPADLIVAAHEAGEAVALFERCVRVGIPVDEVAATVRRELEATGLWEKRYFMGGYDLGIAFPPDWVGPWYFDMGTPMPGKVFEAGMVTNLEVIANSMPIVDTVIYGQEGARVVSSLPRELLVVPV
jgi:Xaa-Pro dipeptidase